MTLTNLQIQSSTRSKLKIIQSHRKLKNNKQYNVDTLLNELFDEELKRIGYPISEITNKSKKILCST